jgi:hypothetical protein
MASTRTMAQTEAGLGKEASEEGPGVQGTLKEPRQASCAEEPSWVRFTEQLGRFVSD